MKGHRDGFTLMELVVVAALMVVISSFLVRYQLSSNTEYEEEKQAARMVYSVFEDARNMAIAQNRFIYVIADLSSQRKQKRIVILRQEGTMYMMKREVILPGKAFILQKSQFESMTGKDLSQYDYTPSSVTIGGQQVSGYLYQFCPDGSLAKGVMLGIGHGRNCDNINASHFYIFINLLGKAFIIPNNTNVVSVNFKQFSSLDEGYTKHKAAWTYSAVTAWDNYNQGYGSAQMFEYVAESTRDYGVNTTWDDSTKQSFGNTLLSKLNSSSDSRQTNWSNLKNDSVLGEAATAAFEAHYALGNTMANGSVSLSEAQEKISAAMEATYATVCSDSQYLKDFNAVIKAYESAYNAAAEDGQQDQRDAFYATLNSGGGGNATSYGSQLAAIMMSLGSSQNILNYYVSSR